MNAKELAALLGVHPNTIYNMIKNGEIRAEKSGRSYIVPNEEVKRLTTRDTHPTEEVIKHIEFVELYFKRDLAAIEELLHESSRKSMNSEPMDINGKDVFDLIDEKGVHQKIIHYLAFIKRYVQHGTSLFQVQHKDGSVSTYGKEVKDEKP